MSLISKFVPSEYIQVLANHNFRRVWLAGLISSAGDIFHRIAILWLVSEETQSVLAVGAVVIASSLPVLLFRLIGGVISDWFDRRRIMVTTDLLQALLVLIIPLLYYLQVLSLPAILVISFLRAVLNQFFQPARQALIPSTVPKNHLAIANSLDSTSRFGISAAVPAMIGILIATVGPIVAFFIDAATFVFSAVLLFGLKLSLSAQPGSNHKLTLRSLLAGIVEGVAYIFREPILRIMAILNLVSIFGFGPYNPVSLLYFRHTIGMDAVQYGLILSLTLLGLTAGTAIAGSWVNFFQAGRTYALGLGLMGVFTMAIGFVPGIWIIFILSAVRAFGNGLIVVSYTTLLQSHTKDVHLGRVFSNMTLISEGLRPLSVAAGISLAQFTNPRFAIITSSLFFMVASLIAIFNKSFRLSESKRIDLE